MHSSQYPLHCDPKDILHILKTTTLSQLWRRPLRKMQAKSCFEMIKYFMAKQNASRNLAKCAFRYLNTDKMSGCRECVVCDDRHNRITWFPQITLRSSSHIRDCPQSCFRVGKYLENRCRPVLVTMNRSIDDVANVLANRSWQSSHTNISIKSDVPPKEKVESILLKQYRQHLTLTPSLSSFAEIPLCKWGKSMV